MHQKIINPTTKEHRHVSRRNLTVMNSTHQFCYLGNWKTIANGKEGTDSEQLLTCHMSKDDQPSNEEISG